MNRPAPRLSFVLVAISFGILGMLTACNRTVYPDAAPFYVQNAAADSVVFWPSTMKYARAGDTVSIRVRGFKRGYVCSDIQDMGFSWRDDSTSDFYTLHSLVLVPGTPHCAADHGYDSLFKRTFPTLPGQTLYLQTSLGASTDSLYYVSGNGFTEIFTHLVSGPDSQLVAGRFLFHDSTALRPARFVSTDSMAPCETFQSAAFKRSGDTLTVRVRRIEADPLPSAAFPPCAGPHADTVEVVFDRFRFP